MLSQDISWFETGENSATRIVDLLSSQCAALSGISVGAFGIYLAVAANLLTASVLSGALSWRLGLIITRAVPTLVGESGKTREETDIPLLPICRVCQRVHRLYPHDSLSTRWERRPRNQSHLPPRLFPVLIRLHFQLCPWLRRLAISHLPCQRFLNLVWAFPYPPQFFVFYRYYLQRSWRLFQPRAAEAIISLLHHRP